VVLLGFLLGALAALVASTAAALLQLLQARASDVLEVFVRHGECLCDLMCGRERSSMSWLWVDERGVKILGRFVCVAGNELGGPLG
jgi:hypothetical protein